MRLSTEAREARKKAHAARIAAKGSENYSELYASQPEQVKIAAEQKAARAAKRAEQDKVSSDAIENASGSLSVFNRAETE